MKVNELYTVEPIDKFQCKEWILKKHYAKRLPPIEYSFGLFCNGECVGICTFGTPLSPALRTLFENKYKVIELNRLVSNDNLHKNALSYFVSSCIKKLPRPKVVVSYADTSANHHGYIYQATNFIYTGLSIKFQEYYVEGLEELHNMSIMDIVKGKDNKVKLLRNKFGDKLKTRERPRKHRYFYFVGNKRDVKIMLKMMPYDKMTYPKGENKKYDASYRTSTQMKLF